jgi:hypothetical protein
VDDRDPIPISAAQAMCLEAMTGKPVAGGVLFYARSKRRRVVPITLALRTEVEKATADVRAMPRSGVLPRSASPGTVARSDRGGRAFTEVESLIRIVAVVVRHQHEVRLSPYLKVA